MRRLWRLRGRSPSTWLAIAANAAWDASSPRLGAWLARLAVRLRRVPRPPLGQVPWPGD